MRDAHPIPLEGATNVDDQRTRLDQAHRFGCTDRRRPPQIVPQTHAYLAPGCTIINTTTTTHSRLNTPVTMPRARS